MIFISVIIININAIIVILFFIILFIYICFFIVPPPRGDWAFIKLPYLVAF